MNAKDMFEKLGYSYTAKFNIIYYSTNDGDFVQFTIDPVSGNSIYTTTPIFMELLQAINQQCKELGWLDE